MNLEHLYTAVELVRNNCYSTNGTETTFLRTYPVMVAAARMPAKDTAEAFLRAACLAHAWMPQTLRLDQAFLRPAVAAFEVACADEVVATEQAIDPIAASLSSVVAASRVLHLANPNVFPFWDERIERFRLGEEPSPYHMGQVRNYLRFIHEIRELTAHPLFLTFHNDFCTAYQARLQQLRIPPYPLTEPKVVEAAITELAGGG